MERLCRDLAKGPFFWDPAQRCLAQILPRGLLQRCCSDIFYRELGPRCYLEISYTDLAWGFVRHRVERSLAETHHTKISTNGTFTESLAQDLLQISLQRDLAQQLLQGSCQGYLAHYLPQRSSHTELADSALVSLRHVPCNTVWGQSLIGQVDSMQMKRHILQSCFAYQRLNGGRESGQ